MKKVILNGEEMVSIKSTHKYLKEKLELPDCYGENLDALWDILSTISEPIYITFINKGKLNKNIGDYGELITNIFVDAAEENSNISFRII